MNYEALLQLYRSRPVFRKLLASIAAEGLDEGRTIVEELVLDGETTRRVAVNLLRDLEVMGCGEFKVGRKGHPSRFEWSVDPRKLGQRLADGADAEPDDDIEAEQDASEAPEAGAPIQASLALDEPQRVDYEHGRGHHRAPAEPQRSTTTTTAASETVAHQYVLRRDLRVTLELPSDLSRREAEVLAAWVRELSFDR